MTVRNIQKSSTVELQKYNGFYRWRGDWPYALYDLYHGYCHGGFCDKKDSKGNKIKLERRHGDGFHLGHFWPRSQPEYFEEMWPALDVDNLMNIILLCPKCNGDTSAEILPDDSILMTEGWKRILRLIRNRWPKIKERVKGHTLSFDVRDKLTFLHEFSLLPEEVYRFDGYVAIAVRDVAKRLLPQVGGRFDTLGIIEHNIASIFSGCEGFIYHTATSVMSSLSHESPNNFSEFEEKKWRKAWRHRCPELYQCLLLDNFLAPVTDEDDCFIKAGLKPFLLIIEPEGEAVMYTKQLPLSTYGMKYVYELLSIVEGLSSALNRKELKVVPFTYHDLSPYEMRVLDSFYEYSCHGGEFAGLMSCGYNDCYVVRPSACIDQMNFYRCENEDEIIATMMRPEAMALKISLENFLYSLLAVDKDLAVFLSEIAFDRWNLFRGYKQEKPWTLKKYLEYSSYWNGKINSACRRHSFLLDAVPEKWSQWLLPPDEDSVAT